MNMHARFPEEFKIEAVKKIAELGQRAAESAARLNVSQYGLYVVSSPFKVGNRPIFKAT